MQNCTKRAEKVKKEVLNKTCRLQDITEKPLVRKNKYKSRLRGKVAYNKRGRGFPTMLDAMIEMARADLNVTEEDVVLASAIWFFLAKVYEEACCVCGMAQDGFDEYKKRARERMKEKGWTLGQVKLIAEYIG